MALFFSVYLLSIPLDFPWASLTLKNFCPDTNKLMQELFQCCVTTNSCYDGTAKPPGLMKLSKARNPFTILAAAASKCVLLLGLDKTNTSTRMKPKN